MDSVTVTVHGNTIGELREAALQRGAELFGWQGTEYLKCGPISARTKPGGSSGGNLVADVVVSPVARVFAHLVNGMPELARPDGEREEVAQLGEFIGSVLCQSGMSVVAAMVGKRGEEKITGAIIAADGHGYSPVTITIEPGE